MSEQSAPTEDRVLRPFGPMPAPQPLPMPQQDFSAVPQPRYPRSNSFAARHARVIAVCSALGLIIYGIHEMIAVVAAGGVTVLEGVMTFFFAITYSWIAMSTSFAIAGLLAPRPKPTRAVPQRPLSSRTAIVMPVYNEDPDMISASLQAMGEDLARIGHAHAFEIVVLSDSNRGDSLVRETVAMERLAAGLAGIMPVWYRRRPINAAKKSGNIEDFVARWGGRYDFMLVLDADSLMEADAILRMIARMEAESDLGLLQSVPRLFDGTTLFARLQQFAGAVYGPVVAGGMAAWQGSDGNYWGHNAIIRTRAFAACCGLPPLPGKPPFGGPILSHDFVEAALLRRAGYRVEMAIDIVDSWEESPPSLIATAIRDRRWAQGNLQHSKVIGAKGLAPASRLHFLIGIMSYLSSPLWLLLIMVGLVLAVQAKFVTPVYFGEDHQLFPNWPVFDSERMLALFGFTLFILFIPKIAGMLRAIMLPNLRKVHGGASSIVLGTIFEILASTLYAPIMMMLQSRHVWDILRQRDSGWAPQGRKGSLEAWGALWKTHSGHVFFGVFLAAVAMLVSPVILAWLSPIVIGLVFAPVLSRWSASEEIGKDLAHRGLLIIPEEMSRPAIARRRDEILADQPAFEEDPLAALARSAEMRQAYQAWLTPPPAKGRGEADRFLLSATKKIDDAQDLDEALAWLDQQERLAVAAHPSEVERLASLAARTDARERAA
ncbi:glucans biosynthesis glucosyltransferase MdoH [Afifella sp. IM 167]|uniref:glucans biosynthesis glucosyltransferase MdoH n=1 Tax=Afifella sp. IM 167 TaxID=2033586 RepID=UPI001CCAD197|nr:glucans biosynthesis glucosyltransferase MdoH [Afifella sp. IM 167]MBZ8131683.1 glucans biosynthesis glucosyltransferase MdoH [Afifella sp. IM 167]